MNGKTVVYVRSATNEGGIEKQIAALKERGIEEEYLFSEISSDSSLERPAFNNMQSILAEGDTVLVQDVSRISRNSAELAVIMKDWKSKGIKLELLTGETSCNDAELPL